MSSAILYSKCKMKMQKRHKIKIHFQRQQNGFVLFIDMVASSHTADMSQAKFLWIVSQRQNYLFKTDLKMYFPSMEFFWLRLKFEPA